MAKQKQRQRISVGKLKELGATDDDIIHKCTRDLLLLTDAHGEVDYCPVLFNGSINTELIDDNMHYFDC
jgi:hypothetical protein